MRVDKSTVDPGDISRLPVRLAFTDELDEVPDAEAASVIVQIAKPTASGRKFTRPCQRRPRG